MLRIYILLLIYFYVSIIIIMTMKEIKYYDNFFYKIENIERGLICLFVRIDYKIIQLYYIVLH